MFRKIFGEPQPASEPGAQQGSQPLAEPVAHIERTINQIVQHFLDIFNRVAGWLLVLVFVSFITSILSFCVYLVIQCFFPCSECCEKVQEGLLKGISFPCFCVKKMLKKEAEAVYLVLWLAILIFISFPVAFLCFLPYVFLSVFVPCLPVLSILTDLLLKGICFPYFCSDNMMHRRPLTL